MTQKLGLLLLGLSAVWAKDGLAQISAQAMALNCLNCHQAQAADSKIPVLDHLSSARIYALLLDFKYDRSPATLMPRIAKGYSDDELAAVAGYLGRP